MITKVACHPKRVRASLTPSFAAAPLRRATFAWLANRRSLACHPKRVQRSLAAHLRASRYGGHPSPESCAKGGGAARI